MHENEIKVSIDVIFQKESDNFEAGIFYEYIIDFSGGPFYCSRDRFLTSITREFDKYTNAGSKQSIKWETYFTLKQLYNKIESNPESRLIFIDYIRRKIFNENFFEEVDIKSTHLAFYFLMKIGRTEDCMQTIIDIFKRDYEKDDDEMLLANMMKGIKIVTHLFNDIYIFINMEPGCFDSVLTKLQEIIKITSHFKTTPSGIGSALTLIHDKLRIEVNSLMYEKVKMGLIGINEEINIDKEQVIDLISKYGFSPEMESFLLELDKIPESEDWVSINSGMISNLRAFSEKLVINIAAQIKQRTGVDYPKDKQSNMGNKRKYLKQHLGLSENDDKFIDSYIKILHEEGGHAFMSEKRYFRLAKNIGIELALFLMSKLDSFLSSK